MSQRLHASILAGQRQAPGGRMLPALAPYVTAGDGGLERTLAVLHALEAAGAACVELGLPFSDPIADGPHLQAAAERALAAGTTPAGVLDLVRRFRAEGGRLPILLFSYTNPLFVGLGGFGPAAAALAEAGGDGFIVPDLPPEEAGELREACADGGLGTVFFATPTSSEDRIRAAAEASTGFLYAIGRVGITGARTTFDPEVLTWLDRVRGLAGETPLAVGFGVADGAAVAALGGHCDLAISGTALVRALHDAGGTPQDAARVAAAFTTALGAGAP